MMGLPAYFPNGIFISNKRPRMASPFTLSSIPLSLSAGCLVPDRHIQIASQLPAQHPGFPDEHPQASLDPTSRKNGPHDPCQAGKAPANKLQRARCNLIRPECVHQKIPTRSAARPDKGIYSASSGYYVFSMKQQISLRLDRILSNLGYATRSTARALLSSGRVSIQGKPATNGACKARPEEVLLDGQPLDHPAGIFIMLHKPAGYVCSHEAGEGALIYDLLPDHWRRRTPVPTSIGRLDKDTTGIVLVTDMMPLVHQLASPKHDIEKLYHVSLDPVGPALEDRLVEKFAAGTLRLDPKDEKPCLPARLVLTGIHTADLTLSEGRFHQVKRMFAACGYTVVALHRSRFGAYDLGDIPEGQWRDCPLPDGHIT